MELGTEERALQLLLWAAEQENPSQNYRDTGDFVTQAGISTGEADLAVQHLKNRGYVDTVEDYDGYAVRLIAEGAAHVDHIKETRNNPRNRVPELRKRMLQWLYEQEEKELITYDWSEFLTSPTSFYLGKQFTEEQVKHELKYLAEKGFVTGLGSTGSPKAWGRPELTPEGRDCVLERDGETTAPTNATNLTNINLTDIDGIVMFGSHNTANQTNSGLNTDTVLKFVGLSRQTASVLQLSEEGEKQLKDEAAELHEAATAPEPERGAMKKFIDSMMRLVTSAPQTVAGELLLSAGKEALQSITS